MFKTASGVEIPFPERLEEKYQISENSITLNLSFEKLKSFLQNFIMGLMEPLFFIIQIPLTKQGEEKIQKDIQTFHSEVFYLDGQTKKQIFKILNQFGKLLLHDGLSRFGVASHETGEEIFIEKYKIITIYSKQIHKYTSLMEKYDVGETEKLVTAWDTFSKDYPGQCSSVVIDNKDIYDVVQTLKKIGMYSAKIVED